MKSYRLYQVDSFTTEIFKGNPAGVITNAEGLSEYFMQNIAREVNNSETAFIFASNDLSFDFEIRYFTPIIEVPSCGHATIAAIYALATEKKFGNCFLKIKTRAGILPIEIVEIDSDYIIKMTQGKIEFTDPLERGNRASLLAALKLEEENLYPDCPVQSVSTGHSKVIIGVKSSHILNQINPNFDMLINLSKSISCNGYFVFTFDSREKNILTEGRMFAPAIGIQEDPVTGNANGPLGAYLVHHKLVSINGETFQFTGAQGSKMGRPGNVAVEVAVRNNEAVLVTITGRAVIVFNTVINI